MAGDAPLGPEALDLQVGDQVVTRAFTAWGQPLDGALAREQRWRVYRRTATRAYLDLLHGLHSGGTRWLDLRTGRVHPELLPDVRKRAVAVDRLEVSRG